jgi:hypothetical protein
MKKLFALSFVVVSVLSLASCKKDYTCTCTDGTTTSSITYHTTKAKAKTTCTALSGGGDVCTVK